MESPGEYLKRERESRGVSLEDISHATKIRVGLLTAIERNNFDALPAAPFVKGFIQAYCKHLGLDVQDALLRYEAYMKSLAESKAAAAQKEDGDTDKKETAQLPPSMITSSRSIIAIVTIALLIIMAGLYARFRKHTQSALPSSYREAAVVNSAAKPKKGEPATSEGHSQSEGQLSLPAVSSNLKKDGKKIKELPSINTVGKEEITLIIEATKPTWLKAEVDSTPPFEVSLREGEKVKWTAKEKLSILIGNAGGINLTFNGNPLDKMGDEGQVVKLILPSMEKKVFSRLNAPAGTVTDNPPHP